MNEEERERERDPLLFTWQAYWITSRRKNAFSFIGHTWVLTAGLQNWLAKSMYKSRQRVRKIRKAWNYPEKNSPTNRMAGMTLTNEIITFQLLRPTCHLLCEFMTGEYAFINLMFQCWVVGYQIENSPLLIVCTLFNIMLSYIPSCLSEWSTVRLVCLLWNVTLRSSTQNQNPVYFSLPLYTLSIQGIEIPFSTEQNITCLKPGTLVKQRHYLKTETHF